MTDPSAAPKDLIGFLDYYFVKKAPFQIPPAGREWIVHNGAWIAVVLLVFALPELLLVLGLRAGYVGLADWGLIYGYRHGYWPWTLGVVLNFGLMALSVPGLNARKLSGWTLMFYAQAVNAMAAIMATAVIGGVIGALISFYILFQIRPLYRT